MLIPIANAIARMMARIVMGASSETVYGNGAGANSERQAEGRVEVPLSTAQSMGFESGSSLRQSLALQMRAPILVLASMASQYWA